jgi:hypothetical protein
MQSIWRCCARSTRYAALFSLDTDFNALGVQLSYQGRLRACDNEDGIQNFMRGTVRIAVGLLFLAGVLVIAACTPVQGAQRILVTLVVDGRERAMTFDLAVTVGEVLRQAQVVLGPLDEVNPPQYSQIADGMRITVARVREETECEENIVPYIERTIPNEALQPGETRLAQPGRNGIEQICYRVVFRDGQPGQPVQTSRVVLTEPQAQVIYVGPTTQLDPVSVPGTLTYISNHNVWLMRDSNTTRRPVTNTNDVDSRVLAVSPDGIQILFTRRVQGSGQAGSFNQLYLIPDTTRDSEPIALVPENVLQAAWVPGEPNTISYSTGEVTSVAPGWRAYNDLFLMRINPQTGDAISVTPLVEASSFGLYSWWGTRFYWSPEGDALAWVRADSMGLVNLSTGEFRTLLTYPVFETRQPWSWRATVSFAPNDDLILTTVHGQPIGNEPPQTSPAFHVTVTDRGGTFSADVVENAGIWSMPRYSPIITDPVTGRTRGFMAYLKARDLSNSINENAQYDLVVADRDGSNARIVFPPAGQPGLNANAAIAWNPTGAQLAFVYQGNLWMVDVLSNVANQLTLDGGASQPIWTR